MITNKKIEIFSTKTDWEGNPEDVSEGFFDVYLEEHSTRILLTIWDERRQTYDEGHSSKGFFILFENLNLTEKSVKYDGKIYTIHNFDKYTDHYGDFHHIEANFK